MQHRDFIVLQKILSEISIGTDMLGDTTLTDFFDNEMLKRALSMTTINIGELVKNLTSDLKDKYKQIPWKAVAGMRDITAHKYQTLRMEDVYNTIKSDFLVLKEQIENILQNEK